MRDRALRRHRHLLLLAPYGLAVWSQILPLLERSAEVVVVAPGDEADLALMATRVLQDAPARFHVAGFCLGAHLALEIYRQAPARISGLALLNTCLAPDSPTQRMVREERIAKLRVKASEMAFPDKVYVEHAAQWLVAPSAYESRSLMNCVSALLAETPLARSLAQQLAMLGRPDSHPSLAAGAVPVLVVGGDHDRVCPRPLAEEIALRAPNAQVRILKGCGHLSPIEKPVELAALLTEWLAKKTDTSNSLRHLEQTA